MTRAQLLLAAAPLALASPALAETAPVSTATASPTEAKAAAGAQSAPKQDQGDTISTGVARARDRLDSATSTSSIRGTEVEKFGARSLAEILRNIPGIRAESVSGEGNASYSIRGLPLASTGSKFMQFQEDGLPVLEFGDISFISSDVFLRADLNLAQVEAIRGGSASTFSSNSPGGVINLISKTGETTGGAIQASAGLDYDSMRVDFDYGAKLSDTLRFNVGGFYREGQGPRDIGYTGYRGGQIKLNVTKEFGDNYIRFYGKYLDDRAPAYQPVPVRVTGTNADPSFESVANFDVQKDSLLSRNINRSITLDGDNKLTNEDVRDGMHPVVKSAGFEAKFDLGGFTINERFRYSDISGRIIQNFPLAVAPASALATSLGGPGARLSYASGPKVGQAIVPTTLNGNGLLATSLLMDFHLNSLDYITNDLRASRVWDLGGGDLTATAGFYKSRQTIDTDWLFSSIVTDVLGNGEGSLVNVTTATGIPQTQNGVFSYGAAIVNTGYRRSYDVNYDVNAPYASLNYHVGKVAIGGSIRYDIGNVRGTLYGSELGGGRVGIAPVDINGNGVISPAESRTSVLPLGSPAPVDYDYHYLSYSAGINYRIAEPLAVFARYSRGGRAAADRILFSPVVSSTDGSMADSADGYDSVRQTELGVKFRQSGITLNLTGFLANTGERNLQINSTASGAVQVQRIIRDYKAYGAEFEGGFRRGPFSLTAGATYTHAEITSDATDPTVVGNTPRHQAKFIYQATPQFENRWLSLGVNVVGTTSSFAQDTNQLKLPGYTLVNPFVQFRPTDRIQLMVNVNNVFDALALTEVTQAAIPASGIVLARAQNGRTISGAIRFSF